MCGAPTSLTNLVDHFNNVDYAYVRVSMTIADRDVEERECRPFRSIRDGYPRFLFTLDPLLQEREGVRHLNMVDFMASEGDLLEG